ncbi:hypothetical protein BC827DRAFT_1152330 [Russula dissimulans]|nr:hypothetical protein BC827DRAFT_1152330 [Russula dissimulans]
MLHRSVFLHSTALIADVIIGVEIVAPRPIPTKETRLEGWDRKTQKGQEGTDEYGKITKNPSSWGMSCANPMHPFHNRINLSVDVCTGEGSGGEAYEVIVPSALALQGSCNLMGVGQAAYPPGRHHGGPVFGALEFGQRGIDLIGHCSFEVEQEMSGVHVRTVGANGRERGRRRHKISYEAVQPRRDKDCNGFFSSHTGSITPVWRCVMTIVAGADEARGKSSTNQRTKLALAVLVFVYLQIWAADESQRSHGQRRATEAAPPAQAHTLEPPGTGLASERQMMMEPLLAC